MESWGTEPPLLEELGDELPLLPQAAIRSAALPATAVSPALLESEYNVNHLACERDMSGHISSRSA
jgi:hypothetical protein